MRNKRVILILLTVMVLTAALITVNRDLFKFTYDLRLERTFTPGTDTHRDYLLTDPVPLKPGAYMLVWAFVKDAAGKTIAQQVVYRRETDVWDWTPCMRQARHDRLDSGGAIRFALPDGAASVRLDFKLTTRGQTVPAKVWVDAVEFTLAAEPSP